MRRIDIFTLKNRLTGSLGFLARGEGYFVSQLALAPSETVPTGTSPNWHFFVLLRIWVPQLPKFSCLKGLKFSFRLVIEAYLALIGRLDNCIVPVSPHSSYSESRRSLNDSPNLSHPSVIVARPSKTSAVKSRPHGKTWLAWISKKNCPIRFWKFKQPRCQNSKFQMIQP